MTNLTAPDILDTALEQLRDRAEKRDNPNGERSMARAVSIFNSWTSNNLSEDDGWRFMIALKQAREIQGKPHMDDYVDGAGYFALLGESVSKDSEEEAVDPISLFSATLHQLLSMPDDSVGPFTKPDRRHITALEARVKNIFGEDTELYVTHGTNTKGDYTYGAHIQDKYNALVYQTEFPKLWDVYEALEKYLDWAEDAEAGGEADPPDSWPFTESDEKHISVLEARVKQLFGEDKTLSVRYEPNSYGTRMYIARMTDKDGTVFYKVECYKLGDLYTDLQNHLDKCEKLKKEPNHPFTKEDLEYISVLNNTAKRVIGDNVTINVRYEVTLGNNREYVAVMGYRDGVMIYKMASPDLEVVLAGIRRYLNELSTTPITD